MNELPDPQECRIRAGDSVAFRRASNILDMALAAAESAAALEKETEDATVAVVAAKDFYNHVRHKIVMIDSCGPVKHVVMGNHGNRWELTHGKYLRQAEESYRLLEVHGLLARSERFKECIGRLMQKISDGQKLETLPAR